MPSIQVGPPAREAAALQTLLGNEPALRGPGRVPQPSAHCLIMRPFTHLSPELTASFWGRHVSRLDPGPDRQAREPYSRPTPTIQRDRVVSEEERGTRKEGEDGMANTGEGQLPSGFSPSRGKAARPGSGGWGGDQVAWTEGPAPSSGLGPGPITSYCNGGSWQRPSSPPPEGCAAPQPCPPPAVPFPLT